MRYSFVVTVLILTALSIIGFVLWELFLAKYFVKKEVEKKQEVQVMVAVGAKVIIEKKPSELTYEDIRSISTLYFRLETLKNGKSDEAKVYKPKTVLERRSDNDHTIISLDK